MEAGQRKEAVSLRKLSVSDGQDVYRLLQRMPEENGFQNTAYGLSYQAFQRWLVAQDACSRGENLQVDYVPQTLYWCYAGNVPVGIAKLRHYLHDGLREVGGHIGYGVAPAFRGKGYATEMLSLVLQKAAEMGIEKVLLTVMKANVASQRVMEKCGGVREKQKNSLYYYWIDT